MDYVALLNQYESYLDVKHPLHILEETKDQWLIATAVCLSGNCTDAAVNKVMPGFSKEFPNPKAILEPGIGREEIIPFIPGISHSGSKSDYLQNIARYLVEHGKFPNSIEEMTKIVGIGRKTAAIVLYRCYKSDFGFPLDTHCLRVLDRLGWLPEAKTPKSLEKALLKVFPEGTRHKSHLILTHHGRQVCFPKAPNCEICKLKSSCTYYTALKTP